MEKYDHDTFLNGLFDLENKVAVVIGGTGVLCGAMAWGLFKAGCRVVLVGRNGEKADAHFRRWEGPPEKAGSFITGANLVVDGGFSVMSI